MKRMFGVWRQRKNIFLWLGLAIGLVLLTAGLYAARTRADAPPETLLDAAIANLLTANARQINAALKISSPGKDAQSSFIADIRASGVLERSNDNKLAYDGTVDLKSHKAGLDLNYAFLLRHLGDGTYLNIKDMPGTAEIKNSLFNRWLILRAGEQPAAPLAMFSDVTQKLAQDGSIAGVVDRGMSDAAGVRAKKFVIYINQDKTRAELEKIAESNAVAPFGRNAAARAALILNNFNVDELAVWVTPSDRQLVKFSAVLTPKMEKMRGSAVALAVEISPSENPPPAIETPSGAQEFSQGNLLWQLVAAGLK